MAQNEQQFIKGFNGGYLLAKFEPELSKKILKNLQVANEYIEGLIFGKDEWMKEKELLEVKELNRLRD
jgi:hypothetical protein